MYVLFKWVKLFLRVEERSSTYLQNRLIQFGEFALMHFYNFEKYCLLYIYNFKSFTICLKKITAKF